MRVAQSIELTESEIKTLTSWSRGRRTPMRLTKRAKIVLIAAEGEQNKAIAELLGIDRRQVSRWRRRFVEKRLAGIEKTRRIAVLNGIDWRLRCRSNPVHILV